MLRFVFFAALFVFSALLSQPTLSVAENTKDQAIIELLEVMNTTQKIEASMQTMHDTIKMNAPYFIKEIKVILAREMEEKYVQQAADLYRQEEFGAQRLYELFSHKINLEKITQEIMIPTYRDNYSEEEIRQLIAFYTSELGQKTLQLNPTITRTISSKTRDISQMALNQAKEELAAELKKSVGQ